MHKTELYIGLDVHKELPLFLKSVTKNSVNSVNSV